MSVKPGDSWQVTIHLRVDHAVSEAFIAALEDHTDAQMEFEVDEDVWAVRGYAAGPPNQPAIEMAAALIAKGFDVEEPAVTVEKLPPTDWVAHVYEGFKPLTLGRFYIHGSHMEDAPPVHHWALKIDAATAFGTGDHGSTSGCLLAFDAIRHRRRVHRVLDVGTGTGILAMAGLRAGASLAVAVDIDPQAVAVAHENGRINGLSRSLHTGVADGTRHGLICHHRPYDVVFANILARPLIHLCKAIAGEVAPGGDLILAGLLNRQAAKVGAAYRRQGLTLARRLDRGIWTTLVMHRPGERQSPHR
ncbi:MAG: 50S ribosomal protein L11 methyltransferase [Pseudomonadota bacterium]